MRNTPQLLVAILATVLSLFQTQAVAQETWPNRPIRLLVAYPPGGGVDLAARVLAPKLSAALGQSVVVENRPGAAGNIAMEALSRATPDGYTLLMNSVPIAINPALYKNLPFDTLKDFTPVAMVASAVYALVVHPSISATSVQELIALSKRQPGLTFASSGIGTPPHLAGERFKMVTGTDLVHVPYKGTGPALSDLMAGHVQMMFADALGSLPHIQSGKLRALAVASVNRFPGTPDLPTIQEAGVKGFSVSGWTILLAPAGVPKPIIDRINREVVRILPMADVKDKLAGDGSEFGKNTPEQAAAFVRSEIEQWSAAVRASGATAQ
jgi:tripartite-type tricarboxylate transporter receptor subunit TctC